MRMEMTWLFFQLSTDNQNGRHLATNFFSDFFRIPLKPGMYRFSGSASLLAFVRFHMRPKRGYGGHLDLINFHVRSQSSHVVIAKARSHGSSVEFAVIVVICGFTKIASTWDLSPSWHIPQQTSRGYAVYAIIQILIEIYSIRLKSKPQIILTIIILVTLRT